MQKIFFAFLCILMAACTNAPADTTDGLDDTAEPMATSETTTSSDNGLVSFRLDGGAWKSAAPGHPDNGYEEEAITDDKTMVRIEAFAADGSYLALTIYAPDGISPGTYPVTTPGMQAIYKPSFKGDNSYLTNGMPDNPGTITITNLDSKRVTGTFAFALRNAGDPEDIRQVTDGQFQVRFTRY